MTRTVKILAVVGSLALIATGMLLGALIARPSTPGDDSPEAGFAREVMASIVGEDNVEAQEPTMGAEDFAYMLQARPGAYCFIANGDGSHREMGHGTGPCMLHNPSYDFNDELIPLGATYWVRLAEAWLAKGPA